MTIYLPSPRSRRLSRPLSCAVSAVLSLAAASAAQAGPQNGVVTSGSATISAPNANLTQIDQNSHSVSIDWQSFDVSASERVNFNQPSANSVALNRIFDQDPSQIQGSLTANGRVFLINPNGIIFGASARINVGSLVASSLDIADVDAVAGRYTFRTAAGQSGAIVNSGQIVAADGGSVTLLGGSVSNDGLIVADYGSVNLGAGRAATLDFGGDGLVRFQVDEGLLSNASGASSAVNNAGEIRADGGQVLLTARAANDVIARAVNNDGVIRAARVENVGGRIRLVGPEGSVVNSGTLDAAGVGADGTGGQVQVLGDQVELSGTSLVDVSGGAGGGTALIGGGFRGEDASVFNAQQTDVQAGAVIKANSTLSGDAGQVAVWADGTTTFDGNIFARATGSDGNGGYAEVSGKEHLSIGGHAWLESANGSAGTLLLDPGSVTIINGGNSAPPAAKDTFNDGWINAQLNGSDLIITTAESTNSATEDLTVDATADISWSDTTTLTLIGANSVSVLGTITNSGTGALVLQSSSGAVSIDGVLSLDGSLTVDAGTNITQSAAVTVGGNLEFDAGGGITQSDALSVTGTSSFTAGGAQSILLNNTGNTFTGAVTIGASSGNLQNVTVTDTTALDLQPLTITGGLTATSGGALNLQALTIGGDLDATGNAITQTGALGVTGTSSFTAAGGQSITLGTTTNSFGGAVAFAASTGSLQDVTVADVTALDLQPLAITGDLTATSGGTLSLQALTVGGNLDATGNAITQTGALTVTGTSDFTAADNQSITLNFANAFTGAVGFASSGPGNLLDITLNNSTALDLGALDITGNLSVTSAGTITQSGALSVGGSSSFTATAGQSVLLDDAANSLTGVVSFAPSGVGNLQDVTVADSTALDLQPLTIDGNLTATSGGALTLQALTIGGNLDVTGNTISQAGTLTVTGTSDFTAADNQSITLNSANAFTGAVGFASSGPGSLLDITLNNSTALDLGALDITGNLSVTSTGTITQSGALSVGGDSSFTAALGQSVLLDDAGNDFTGAVSIAGSGGNLQDVTLQDSTAIELQALSLAGDLSVTAGGDITPSGALVIAGDSIFTSAAGQSITLDNAANSFGGAVSFAASTGSLADVAVTDITALDLQTLAIGGNLTATSGAALNLQALTIGGNLAATGNSITQTGALDITGTSSFTAAGGQSIALGNGTNAFGGAVTFAASSGNLQNVTVTDTTALDLQPLTITGALAAVSGGALNLQSLDIGGNLDATGNSITQTGALDITGTSNFTAAGGQSISLGNTANSFGGAVTFAASSGNLQNVTVTDTTALDLQPLTISGALTAVSGGALSLQALTIGGNLDATGNSIAQTGALTVSGTSDFTAAGGQSVVLNNPGNTFTGAVSFASSGPGNLLDVTLNNSTALDLQALTIDGNLAVVAGGGITQSGALAVGGASSFTADDGDSIVLDDAANDFTGTVSFVSGGPGNLQDVTVSDSTALALQALTIDGDLSVTSGGAITQSGALVVGSTSDFATAAGQSIVLDQAGNSFAGTVSVAATSPGNLQDVTLRDSTALDLQALSIDGNLSVNAAAISQSGAFSVGGTASFVAAAGQSVVLNNAGNDFVGGVSLAANGVGSLQNVTLRDSTALDLQSLAVAGNLSVTADSITQSGALSVGGAASFAADAGQSILLSNAGNSFGGAVNLAATGLGNLQDVALRDSTALQLQALTIDGDLTVTAGGAISQPGSLSVAGAAAFRTLNDAGAGITLDGTNSFGSVQAAVRNGADSANAPASIIIHESDDTLLGDVQTGSGQSVSIVSAGAIEALANTSITTSSASLNAAADIGTTTAPVSLVLSNGDISAGSPGSIYLANAGSIGSTVTLDHLAAGGAGAIEFESNGNIQVSDVQAGSSVTLTSTGGSILDDNVDGAGSQIVTDALSLAAAGAIGEAAGVGNGTLDLQTDSVLASAQSGAIYLDDTEGDINIRQVSAGGPVWIQAAGSILDDPSDAGPASISSAAGGVQLNAVDNIGTVTDMLTRQGAPIAVDTNGGALSAHVASATGQINLDIADGSNPVAGVGAISAGGAGRLLIQSAGDLSLTSFSSAVSGFAEAGFSADGTLQLSALPGLLVGSFDTLLLRGGTDISSATRVLEIGADHLIFESGGQGGDITLNTSVDRLDASIGNDASLIVDEGSGDITLGTITAGGDVSISARNILDDGDLNGLTRVTAGDAVSLTTSAAIGSEDGSGGGRIDTVSGSVSVSSDAGPVFISHLGDVQVSGEAHGGLIDIVAPTGDITVNGVLRASGPLTLTAGTNAAGTNPAIAGNIALTGTAQSDGTVALSAQGGGVITDASGTATHLSAADANLTATRIGSQGNRLNVDVGSLNANAPAGIYIDAADAIELRSITAQTVAISAVGNITDDGDAQTRITADSATLSGSALGATGTGNELDTAVDSLSANTSAGGIHIGELDSIELATVNASGAGNDVVITASGAITDDGDDTTRIGGGSLTLTASAIGAAGAHGELDTQATSLTASTSGGGIFIGEADDLQLKAITADAGNGVAISAGGALTDDGNDATRVTGDNVVLSASTIGAADNRIDTAASVLSATSTAGGIYVDERDSVTLAAVQASGTGNTVDLRTANNGNIIVQNVTTQGGAVNLAAGGTGSLNVTGAIESNNGVVNLTAGNALAVPGLSTGTGSVVLHTVNDLNVGTITAGSISITSDTGNVSLGTVNAGTGTASIAANNGTINDGTATSLTAGRATMSARSIGSEDNPLNIAVGTLTANASAGGVFIDEANGLTVASITSAGGVNLTAGGALVQDGGITSAGSAISLLADSIAMQANATTNSDGGDITYIARSGDITLGALDAGAGRALTIAGDSVYSALGVGSAINNITAAQVEVRAGGLNNGPGEIGTAVSPLAISTPAGTTRSVFVVVPAVNGIQTITPWINYAGPSFSILLKGYSGSGGALFFDPASAFTADTVLLNGESIVPLLNGRIAVNSDSLSAATQALASGVVNRVSVDWAAFDPDVSLFGTLDPPLRLPADQIDEAEPQASLIPPGTTLVMTRHGWKLVPLLQQISMVL